MSEFICPKCGRHGTKDGKSAHCVLCRREKQKARYWDKGGRQERALQRARVKQDPVRHSRQLAIRRASSRRQSLKKSRRRGTVYFVQEVDRSFIKVGFTTKDMKGRLKELQCGNASLLVCLAVMSGTRLDEALLHERFAEVRVHGEWFRPVPALLDFIAGLSAPPLAQAA